MNDSQLLSQINEFLKRYCNALLLITDSLNGAEIKGSNKNSIQLLFEFIVRTNSNLFSVQKIIESQINSIRLEHSIGLLLRSSLFDSIIIYYLNFDSEQNGTVDYNKFEKSVLKITSSHVERAFNDYKINDVNLIQKFKSQIVNTGKRFKSLYGEELTIRKYIEAIKAKNNNPKYSKIYDYWEIYSKYEHYGLFSYYIQTQKNAINVTRLAFSLDFIMISINFMLENLKALNQGYIQNDLVDSITEGYLTYLAILKEHELIKIKNVCD